MPKAKPRVLLLHPHCFSQRDMQFYAPLLDEFDIRAVTPRLRPDRRTYQGVPQVPLLSLDQILGAVPPAQTVLDKALRLRSENLYHYFGLEKEFAHADLVECLETFHPYCRQAVKAKKRHGFALAFSVHENIAFAHENLAYRRNLKRSVFAHGDAFFALCEQGRNSLVLEGAPPEKIHLSGAGTDTDLYQPAEPDAGVLAKLGVLSRANGGGEITLLFAGRLVWEKGVFDCFHALALLGKMPNAPTFRLVVAGDGLERSRLETLAARLQLQNRVQFLGRVATEEMLSLYRRADIGLVPSIPTPKWQEQFGCVLIEALACGCPVVATRTGATLEVTGGLVPLVAPAQHTDLARAIFDLACDPARRERIAREGRAHVVRNYDNRVVAERIARVYRALLENRAQ